MNYKQTKVVEDLAKPVIKVLEKLGWKWKSRPGQFVIYKGKLGLIDNFCPDSNNLINVSTENGEFIPVLHWEDDIEQILEETLGYRMRLEKYSESMFSPDKYVFECKIDHRDKEDLLIKVTAKTRQEVVMLAVIELGKELK